MAELKRYHQIHLPDRFLADICQSSDSGHLASTDLVEVEVAGGQLMASLGRLSTLVLVVEEEVWKDRIEIDFETAVES